MAPTPPPFARARSVSSKIRFFSSAVKMRRCALAGTSTSAELVTKGTAILASLTMVLLAALLRNYPRGKCLIDIGTEGYSTSNDTYLYTLQASFDDQCDSAVETEAVRRDPVEIIRLDWQKCDYPGGPLPKTCYWQLDLPRPYKHVGLLA